MVGLGVVHIIEVDGRPGRGPKAADDVQFIVHDCGGGVVKGPGQGALRLPGSCRQIERFYFIGDAFGREASDQINFPGQKSHGHFGAHAGRGR